MIKPMTVHELVQLLLSCKQTAIIQVSSPDYDFEILFVENDDNDIVKLIVEHVDD